MKFDFANSAHDVLFQFYYKRGIVLIGDVQKRVRVSDNLVFGVCNMKKRRILLEENNALHYLSVNFGVDNVIGQKIGSA